MKNSPMLSVLIPVYNWDIEFLLNKLTGEIVLNRLQKVIEVVIVDDNSTNKHVQSRNYEAVRMFEDSCSLRYEQLSSNVGRAQVRNILADFALGENFLFLDCDTLPDSSEFLTEYLNVLRKSRADVICGGCSYYTRTRMGHEYDFYLYFSSRTDVHSADVRNRAPWQHVLSSNVLIRKSIFFDVPFDERFTGYGYEDCEWAIRISQKYSITHIDNSVSHLGLIEKLVFYERMRQSIKNYYLLAVLHPQYFSQTQISKYASLVAKMPTPMLKLVDRMLSELFLTSKNNEFCYILFQLNKAILLALNIRNDYYKEKIGL